MGTGFEFATSVAPNELDALSVAYVLNVPPYVQEIMEAKMGLVEMISHAPSGGRNNNNHPGLGKVLFRPMR